MNLIHWFFLIGANACLILLFIYMDRTYQAMPERLACHFGITGRPDFWMKKESFFKWYRMIVLIANLIVLVLYMIFLRIQSEAAPFLSFLYFIFNFTVLFGYRIIYRFNVHGSKASMVNRHALILSAVVLMALFLFLYSQPFLSKCDSRQLRFAEELLIKHKTPEPCKVFRWVKSPIVGLKNAEPEDVSNIQQVISQLNSILRKSGTSLRLREKEENTVDIDIIFAPQKDFQALANALNLSYVPEHGRQHFTFSYNDRYEIYRSTILLDSAYQGLPRKRALTQFLIRTLGPVNTCELFADSVFIKNGSKGIITERDRKLIKLLYEDLKPGDDEAGLRRAFKKHWKELD